MSVSPRPVAILYADLVGYSVLVAMDEAAAQLRSGALRDMVTAEVASGDGRVTEASAEGAVAVFATPGAAYASAERILARIAARNAGLTPEERFEVTIGIAMGPVEEELGAISGAAVRVAVAAHTLADPGGIALAEDAWRSARKVAVLRGTLLPARRFSNLGDPVRVFVVPPSRAAYLPWLIRKRRLAPVLIAGALVLATALGGAGWWVSRQLPPAEPPPAAPAAPARPEIIIDAFDQPTLNHYDGGGTSMTFYTDSGPQGQRALVIRTTGENGWWGVVFSWGTRDLSGYEALVFRGTAEHGTPFRVMLKDDDESWTAAIRLEAAGGPSILPFTSFTVGADSKGDRQFNRRAIKEMQLIQGGSVPAEAWRLEPIAALSASGQ